MTMRLQKNLVSAALVGLCAGAVAQEREAAPQLKMTGTLELGAAGYDLTGGYPARHTSFVRGELKPDADQRWTGEIANISEFGDSGSLLVLAYEKTIDHHWVVQVGASGSDSGATLPRLRFDLALGRKWLDNANLVTTLGITTVQAKDAHSDHAVQFSTAYYFDGLGWSWSLEGGVRNNMSNPGSVSADSYFAALTLSRPKVRTVSLRLGSGQEGYQLVGDNTALVNFSSDTLLLTWREWLTANSGLQWRLDRYRNPFYSSSGIEASWFLEF